MRSNTVTCLGYVGLALSFCSLGFGQEIGNKASYPSISQARPVTSPPSQDHTDHMTIWQIDWAAAGSRPRDPIYNHRECSESRIGLVSSHNSYRTYGDGVAERESAEYYGSPVLWWGGFKHDWRDFENRTGDDHASGEWSAKGNIKVSAALTCLTQERRHVNPEVRPINMPNSIFRQVDGSRRTWNPPVWKGQSIKYMIGRYKGTIGGDEKCGSFKGAQFPISGWMSLEANDGRNRPFDICNSIHKRILPIDYWRWYRL